MIHRGPPTFTRPTRFQARVSAGVSLHRPTMPSPNAFCQPVSCPTAAVVWRRELNFKPTFESGPSHLSFKRIVPGAFNTGLIGRTCPTAAAERWSRSTGVL